MKRLICNNVKLFLLIVAILVFSIMVNSLIETKRQTNSENIIAANEFAASENVMVSERSKNTNEETDAIMGSILNWGLCVIFSCLGLIGGFIFFFIKIPINGAYGYRSKRSIRNAATWRYANKKLGLLMLIQGSIILLTSLAMIMTKIKTVITFWVIIGVELVTFIGMFIFIEYLLKRYIKKNDLFEEKI